MGRDVIWPVLRTVGRSLETMRRGINTAFQSPVGIRNPGREIRSGERANQHHHHRSRGCHSRMLGKSEVPQAPFGSTRHCSAYGTGRGTPFPLKYFNFGKLLSSSRLCFSFSPGEAREIVLKVLLTVTFTHFRVPSPRYSAK